ncbi:MAG: 50S ribosomal protein L1 [Nitrospirae bacterium]|nr:50S ribosomal protein L1 [Nitrospirota bacterium]
MRSEKRGKRYLEAKKLLEPGKAYLLEEALEILKKMPHTKFDETIDISFRLGIDSRQADQQVRGTLSLPEGTGKKVRVLVFAKGEKAQEARDAGADFVGEKELIDKVSGGWLDFDVAVATPDIMREVSKLGRLLGPRGLMPNPKVGTVTFDLRKTIQAIQAGRVEFRADKSGNLHLPVGKVSFDKERLVKNVKAAIEAIQRAKPPACKGRYLKRAALSLSMGPGINLDLQSLSK